MKFPRLVSVLLLCVAANSARAAEPWADPRLALTNGIFLWLDASRQTAARGANGLTPLQSGRDALEIVFDGSGRQQHLRQPLLASRPRFRQEFNGAMLAFDGVDDFLAGLGSGAAVNEATVFIVAAPRTNGGYRAFLSGNALGQNDFTSGFNLDTGGAATDRLVALNAEGAGFAGEKNLLPQSLPSGRWHVFSLVAARGRDGVKLFLDGQAQGSRDRAAGSGLRLDEITLGARRFSHTAERPYVQGFYQGQLAEVIVFDRALPEAERQQVGHYLGEKYGALLRGIGGGSLREGAVPLVAVSNPPPVQVFAPGFTARELPVQLNNINNVRYRPDGKLLAVGYDGRVWLLTDTDGDGLEDRVEAFWDKQTLRAPVGAALTPPGYARGQGVFIPGKEKVVLLLDTNRDDRADEEITIATWTERSEQSGVDALGVAVGPDGGIYFCIGAASYTEPFLINKATGGARYRTTMDRGTIQRLSPDFKTRETVATGIRFAIGLAFNRAGDLFCTDQEGATWRHDGNPFDELLHIQTGRHYGFPPRHPKHLPDVFDEPSTFDYGPQHQCTCGLGFNRAPGLLPGSDPRPGAATQPGDAATRQEAGGTFFGPAPWADNAIVSGYSRGKLWRTQLVKTAAGYVAQTHQFATLQALTVDACVSPRGDLMVATHGGQPDWGSGPNGKGKLFRLRYEDTNAPQPVAVWNASPTDLCVAFDRALNLESLRDLTRHARMESGLFVSAGDRFETIRPGYQVVYDQLSAPRSAHEILTTQLSPDHRTLTLRTRPRTVAVNYAVTFPSLTVGDTTRPALEKKSAARDSAAHRETDLLADLSGVGAIWKSDDGKETWAGWLPHADLQVARELTRGSAEHERLFVLLTKRGTLTLRGQLDLFQMLQPAIQPGAKIDWERPAENINLVLGSSGPFTARVGARTAMSARTATGAQHADLAVRAPGKPWPPFEITLPTGGRELNLTATWSTDEDARGRAFPLRRFLLPWAQPADVLEKSSPPGERVMAEIAGGNWLRGRQLYFSEKLACAKCHVIRGEGGRVGPELSNLIHRDYASVRQDIQLPNATLNPDHVASFIELTDGESVNAIILSDKDNVIQLAMAGGVAEVLPRARVKSIRPAPLSLMPEGLWEVMSEGERRDLMTFLLTVPLEPHPAEPIIQGHKLPEPRRRAEVERVLGGTAFTPLQTSKADGALPRTEVRAPLRIVLCAAPKDAGHNFPGLHDYPIWRERWSKLLALADGVKVETADRWPTAEQWKNADLIAFFSDNPGWSAEKAGDLDAFLARGGGLVFLHWAVNGGKDADVFAQRIGLAWGAGARFRHGVEDLTLQPHEITAGLPSKLSFVDETYWKLKPGGDFTPLATSVEDGEPQPQVWVRTQGPGRVFACLPGHFTWTFDDPLFRVLLLRGLAWAAHQPLDRFHELVTIGARMQE